MCVCVISPDEAGRYLETYKSYEKKPADVLKEQVEKDYLSKVSRRNTHTHKVSRRNTDKYLEMIIGLGSGSDTSAQ